MTSGPRLKTKPEDFLVRENLLAPLADPAAATHRYLLLRKTGYTTFEAIRLLADRLGCATVDIT